MKCGLIVLFSGFPRRPTDKPKKRRGKFALVPFSRACREKFAIVPFVLAGGCAPRVAWTGALVDRGAGVGRGGAVMMTDDGGLSQMGMKHVYSCTWRLLSIHHAGHEGADARTPWSRGLAFLV